MDVSVRSRVVQYQALTIIAWSRTHQLGQRGQRRMASVDAAAMPLPRECQVGSTRAATQVFAECWWSAIVRRSMESTDGTTTREPRTAGAWSTRWVWTTSHKSACDGADAVSLFCIDTKRNRNVVGIFAVATDMFLSLLHVC